MNINELLTEERISLDLSATDKFTAIKELVGVLGNHGHITDKDNLLHALQEREELESTGIGDGIAIPHVRTELAKEMMIAFGRSAKGVDFSALDNEPVHLFFLVVTPKEDSSKLMRILAKLCRLLKKEEFRQALLTAQSKQIITELIEAESSF